MSIQQKSNTEFPTFKEMVTECSLSLSRLGESIQLKEEKHEIYKQLYDKNIGSEGKKLLRKKLDEIEARLSEIERQERNFTNRCAFGGIIDMLQRT